MSPDHSPPAYPVFVVLPQAAARLAALRLALAPLCSVTASTCILGVDLHYRSVNDMALLALRFDARQVTPVEIAHVTTLAAKAGCGVLDVARLMGDARRRFLLEYLPLFDVCTGNLPTVDHAIRVLSRELAATTIDRPAPPPLPGERLEVRFRRGESWRLGRLTSMTREGVFVATGAPPRLGDAVSLELSSHGAVFATVATVVRVTTEDAATLLGAAGFGARFLCDAATDRLALGELVAATGRPRAVPPPPRRRDARYPVNAPVLVRTATSQARLAALDVSRRGLFVASDRPPPVGSGPVHVSFPLDDDGPPILATGRIARSLPESAAMPRGLAPGFGLELQPLSASDEKRFAAFVARVGRRAQRSVLVGASAASLPHLCGQLAAAGYGVVGASDAVALVARASSARPPDLVLVDASLAEQAAGASLVDARRALAARMVPVVALESQSAARRRVDEALLAARV